MTPDPLLPSGKLAVARALAQIDAAELDAATFALLDAAWPGTRGHVVGLTGAPGVGKSTLASALIAAWRRAGRRVAVIAVDPSSRRTGGAILGDRTRLDVDPEDDGVLVRSLAARDRLGGLATAALPSVVLLRALFDIVLVETVGVGQSETEVADVADTVIYAFQPGSGDSLQLMKAGIVEIPDIALVTKADMGEPAERARRELLGSLGTRHDASGWRTAVLAVAAPTGSGIDQLVATIEAHRAHLAAIGDLARRRHAQACLWLEAMVRSELGRIGVEQRRRQLDQLAADPATSPLGQLPALLR